MLSIFAVLMALVVSAVPSTLEYQAQPALAVPACPTTGSVTYNTSVPDKSLFPLTQVDLCYDNSSIHIKFTALEEKDFYCMSKCGPPNLSFLVGPSLGYANILKTGRQGKTLTPTVTDNQSLGTNGEIYNYEVMEAFIVGTYFKGKRGGIPAHHKVTVVPTTRPSSLSADICIDVSRRMGSSD